MIRSRSAVSTVLAEGRLAYVAIDVGRGPLVTPVLYGARGDDLWFVTNRNALKAKVLARRPSVGWVVGADGAAVVMTGEAQLFSLSDPRAAVARAALLTRAPGALLSWAKRNPRQVAGFLGDSIVRPRRALPQDVVLVRLKPATSLVVPLPSGHDEPAADDLVASALPASLAHLAARPTGVLGLITPEGPVALPVAWDGTTATLPEAAADLVADPRAASCVTFDDPVRNRPTQQRGVVLRGDGSLSRDAAGLRWTLTPSRVTYWDGFDTRTSTLAPPAALAH